MNLTIFHHKCLIFTTSQAYNYELKNMYKLPNSSKIISGW